MTDHADLPALQAELAALRARIDELTAEEQTNRDSAVTRRRLLTGLAGLGAVGAVGVAAADPELLRSSDVDDDITAQLKAHVDATTDAHLAPAIGSTPTGDLTGTDVQENLAELDARLTGLLTFTPDSLQDYAVLTDDFAGFNVDQASGGGIGELGWQIQTRGAGNGVAPGADFEEPGLITLSVSAVPDSAEILLNPFLVIGSPEFVWEARVRGDVASSAQDGAHRAGVMSQASTAPTDGAWFEAAYDGGSTEWRAVSRNDSGTPEVTPTGVTPAEATWQRLRIICDGAGALHYFVDDALVATHTTVTAAGATTPRFGNVKTVGTSVRNLRVGYCYFRMAVTR